MKLVYYNYTHCLHSVPSKPNNENLKRVEIPKWSERKSEFSSGFYSAQVLLGEVHTRGLELGMSRTFSDLHELLDAAYCGMFVSKVSDSSTGEIMFIDFDDDKTLATHVTRLRLLKNDMNLTVNAWYSTHSYDISAEKAKLRYVIRFDSDVTRADYEAVKRYLAENHGADSSDITAFRRTYGTSGQVREVFDEKPNTIKHVMKVVTPWLKARNERTRLRQQEAQKNAAFEAGILTDLHVFKDFFGSLNEQDLDLWATTYTQRFGMNDHISDQQGRYMTTYRIVLNAAIYYKDIELAQRVIDHYDVIHGHQLKQLQAVLTKYLRDETCYFSGHLRGVFDAMMSLTMSADNGFTSIYSHAESTDKYVTPDKVEHFLINENFKLGALFAQAGQGKTYQIVKSLRKHEKTFVFLLPTVAITENQKSADARIIAESDENAELLAIKRALGFEFGDDSDFITSDAEFFTGKNPVNDSVDSTRFVFMTYDQIDNYRKHATLKRDFMIVDEAHLLSGFMNIARDKRAKLQKIAYDTSLFTKIVHTTATPFNLPDVYQTKLSFLRKENKPMHMLTIEAQAPFTKSDKVYHTFCLIEKLRQYHGVDLTKQKVLIFAPMRLELMHELQHELALKYGVKVVTVDSKSKDVRGSESFKTFNALVKRDGAVDASIVLATSILNTGVDIHDVFDHTWVLNSRDLSTVLQAYSRDRGDKNTFTLAVQERDFKAKIWDEDTENYVDVPGERLKVSTKPYNNTPDLSAVRYEEAVTRDLLDDTTVYISHNDIGQAIIVNEIYEIQNSNYQAYIQHQMSPELLKRCFFRLNIKTKHEHIGFVPFDSGAEIPNTKKKHGTPFAINEEWKDLIVKEITSRRQSVLKRKKDISVHRPMSDVTYDQFRKDEEFKLALKLSGLAATSDKYSGIKAETFVNGLVTVCSEFREQQQATTLSYSAVEAVVIELGGRLTGVSGSTLVHGRIDTVKGKTLTAQEYKVWLRNEFKPLITARGTERIAVKGLEEKLKGFGYEVEKTKKRVNTVAVWTYKISKK